MVRRGMELVHGLHLVAQFAKHLIGLLRVKISVVGFLDTLRVELQVHGWHDFVLRQ